MSRQPHPNSPGNTNERSSLTLPHGSALAVFARASTLGVEGVHIGHLDGGGTFLEGPTWFLALLAQVRLRLQQREEALRPEVAAEALTIVLTDARTGREALETVWRMGGAKALKGYLDEELDRIQRTARAKPLWRVTQGGRRV